MPELPLVEELLPAPDPVATAERFLGQPHLLFLDSAADPERHGRHSFLMAAPSEVIRTRGPATPSALAQARSLLGRCRAEAVPGLPPFQGGLAGYLAYDYGAVLERIPPTRYDDLALPDAVLGLYDWVLAWDHAAGRAWIVSTGLPARGADQAARAAERLEWVRRQLAGPSGGATGRVWSSPPRGAPAAPAYPVEGTEFARGITAFSAAQVRTRRLPRTELVHRDNLVIL